VAPITNESVSGLDSRGYEPFVIELIEVPNVKPDQDALLT
jgi:hypothetical protein